MTCKSEMPTLHVGKWFVSDVPIFAACAKLQKAFLALSLKINIEIYIEKLIQYTTVYEWGTCICQCNMVRVEN